MIFNFLSISWTKESKEIQLLEFDPNLYGDPEEWYHSRSFLGFQHDLIDNVICVDLFYRFFEFSLSGSNGE